jgi:hypothetical protein
MDWKWNRRQVLRAGAVTLAVSAMARSATRSALAQDIPTSPETGAIKMAIEPWLAYGQWQIAAKNGNFANGLTLSWNFTTDADLNAAFQPARCNVAYRDAYDGCRRGFRSRL